MSGECENCGEHCLDCTCNDWVSAKCELPEEFKVVLVTNENFCTKPVLAYYKKNSQVVNGQFTFDKDDKGFFCLMESYVKFPLSVTHWKTISG